MSLWAGIYVGVVAVAWPLCALGISRFGGRSTAIGALVAGVVVAFGWPLTLPLIAGLVLARRIPVGRGRPQLPFDAARAGPVREAVGTAR